MKYQMTIAALLLTFGVGVNAAQVNETGSVPQPEAAKVQAEVVVEPVKVVVKVPTVIPGVTVHSWIEPESGIPGYFVVLENNKGKFSLGDISIERPMVIPKDEVLFVTKDLKHVGMGWERSRNFPLGPLIGHFRATVSWDIRHTYEIPCEGAPGLCRSLFTKASTQTVTVDSAAANQRAIDTDRIADEVLRLGVMAAVKQFRENR